MPCHGSQFQPTAPISRDRRRAFGPFCRRRSWTSNTNEVIASTNAEVTRCWCLKTPKLLSVWILASGSRERHA